MNASIVHQNILFTVTTVKTIPLESKQRRMIPRITYPFTMDFQGIIRRFLDSKGQRLLQRPCRRDVIKGISFPGWYQILVDA